MKLYMIAYSKTIANVANSPNKILKRINKEQGFVFLDDHNIYRSAIEMPQGYSSSLHKPY